MEEIKALVVKVTGSVQKNNFAEFQKQFQPHLDFINTREITSKDASTAAGETIKMLMAGEKAIVLAKQVALDQTKDIKSVFVAMDELAKDLRDARLKLNRKNEQWKVNVKAQIISDGISAYVALDEEMRQKYSYYPGEVHMREHPVKTALKGKSKPESMKKAVETVLAKKKEALVKIETLYKTNAEILDAACEKHRHLYPDHGSLLQKDTETLREIIHLREENFKQEQARKKEAEKYAKEQEARGPIQGMQPIEEAAEVNKEAFENLPPTEPTPAEVYPVHTDDRYAIVIYIKGSKDRAVEIARVIDDTISDSEDVEKIKVEQYFDGR